MWAVFQLPAECQLPRWIHEFGGLKPLAAQPPLPVSGLAAMPGADQLLAAANPPLPPAGHASTECQQEAPLNAEDRFYMALAFPSMSGW